MKFKTLKQGELDGLCSAYSVYNSIKWINDGKFMDIADYYETCEIFKSAFTSNILTLDVVLDGADVDVPLKLLEHMKSYSNVKYQFKQNTNESLTTLLDKGICIVGFSGLDQHWTVFTHYDEKYYYVFDSSVYKKFLRKNVIFNQENSNKICIVNSDIIQLTID